MAKGVKMTLIVSLCCFIAGLMTIGGCAIAVRTGNSKLMMGWHEAPLTQKIDLESVDNAVFTLVGESLTVRTGPTAQLEWVESYENQYDVSHGPSGRLSFSHKANRFHLFWNGSIRGNANRFLAFLNGTLGEHFRSEMGAGQSVILTLPQNHPVLDSLRLQAASSELTAGGVQVDSLSLTAADGRMVLNDCKVGSLELDGASGKAEINNGEVETLEAQGADLYVRTNKTALSEASVKGLNARFSGTLPGTKDDYSFMSNGLSATMNIDGTRYRGNQTISGDGGKRISSDGLNSELDIRFEE